MSVAFKPTRTARPAGPRPAFRGAPVHVRVPATSANLGPGFDSLGLALGRYDDVIAQIGEHGAQVDVAGEGAGDVPLGEDHLIVRAMRAAFDLMGGQPRGIDLVCANRIPHGRGLGSSSAAICAGILLARALVLGGEDLLPDRELLPLAGEIEGHPDNVAACLLGGMTIAWIDAGTAHSVRLQPDPAIRVLAFIPPTISSTKAARGLLPEQVPFADAVFNTSRAALLVAAMTGSPESLLTATDDRLHQPYRTAAMPESAQLVATLRAQGIAAMISGAGPSVLALTPDPSEAAAALAWTPAGWVSEDLAVDVEGAHVVVEPTT